MSLDWYSAIRPLVFTLETERAHDLALKSLQAIHPLLSKIPQQTVHAKLMGLALKNPIGLAAGLDKNGAYADALASLGFGYIEVGTVTPKPQAGNPKPRLFRLAEDQAIINRMGFNNHGVDNMVLNLKKRRRFDYKLGVNIGKNKNTPNDQAVNDYLYALEKLYPYADYFSINISSPNTPGLRDLQEQSARRSLMTTLAERREQLAIKHGRHLPLALKIAPDMQAQDFIDIGDDVLQCGFQGLIATNTTQSRAGLRNARFADQSGGLSGKPLQYRSRDINQVLATHKPEGIDLISVGGIDSSEEALTRIEHGAAAVQIYTALIYQGPALVKQIINGFQRAG